MQLAMFRNDYDSWEFVKESGDIDLVTLLRGVGGVSVAWWLAVRQRNYGKVRKYIDAKFAARIV